MGGKPLLRISVCVLLIWLCACANVSVLPPPDRQFPKARTYQLSYEEAWLRAVDWFADHNVTIEKIEKESGLLTAKYTLRVDDEYMDCGEFKVSGVLSSWTVTRIAWLNLTVRKISESRSKVSVNFFGRFSLAAHDAWDGTPISRRGPCVSTGSAEASILDTIGY